MSWLFSIPLRTVNNTTTQENVSVCTDYGGLSCENDKIYIEYMRDSPLSVVCFEMLKLK